MGMVFAALTSSSSVCVRPDQRRHHAGREPAEAVQEVEDSERVVLARDASVGHGDASGVLAHGMTLVLTV